MKPIFRKTYLLAILTMLLSCKEENKVNGSPISEDAPLKTSSKLNDSVPVKGANLEDIPFSLPKNWVYNRITDEVKKTWENPESGFVAIASDPIDSNFSVTVWEYEADTLEEVLPLFKRDLEALSVSVDFKVENGIVHGTTRQQPMADFKWKGKHIKNGDKITFIAVGSFAAIYEDNMEYINTIFNSIYDH